jgi:hypothetical protein
MVKNTKYLKFADLEKHKQTKATIRLGAKHEHT